MTETATVCSTSGDMANMFYGLVLCNRWIVKVMEEGGSSVRGVRRTMHAIIVAQEPLCRTPLAQIACGRHVSGGKLLPSSSTSETKATDGP